MVQLTYLAVPACSQRSTSAEVGVGVDVVDALQGSRVEAGVRRARRWRSCNMRGMSGMFHACGQPRRTGRNARLTSPPSPPTQERSQATSMALATRVWMEHGKNESGLTSIDQTGSTCGFVRDQFDFRICLHVQVDTACLDRQKDEVVWTCHTTQKSTSSVQSIFVVWSWSLMRKTCEDSGAQFWISRTPLPRLHLDLNSLILSPTPQFCVEGTTFWTLRCKSGSRSASQHFEVD